MEERRKHPRKDLMSYSQVFNIHDGNLIGYLGDINLSGAMVISDIEIQKNVSLTISIQLPELDGFSDSTLTLPVRVAWCKQDISPEYFNVGMEFKELTDKQKKIIEAIIETYEFRRQKPDYPQHPNQMNNVT